MAERPCPWDAWDRTLAARYADLPIPRPSYALTMVMVPGSRRVHARPEVEEVVGMLTPTWPIIEPRWSGVTTACGRGGPFASLPSDWPERQHCGRCWAYAWEGVGA